MKLNFRGLNNRNNNNDAVRDEDILKSWSAREKMNKMEIRHAELRAELEEELHPSKCCLHSLYDGFRYLTCLSSFFLLVGQLITLISQEVPPIHYVLRSYVILLCTLICFNECECTAFITNSAVLRVWITRGLLYAFVGILSLAENDIHKIRNGIPSDDDVVSGLTTAATTLVTNSAPNKNIVAIHYVTVVSWLTISCGLLYCAMGSLCIGLVMERLQSYYNKRLELAKHSQRSSEKYLKLNLSEDEDDNSEADNGSQFSNNSNNNNKDTGDHSNSSFGEA